MGFLDKLINSASVIDKGIGAVGNALAAAKPQAIKNKVKKAIQNERAAQFPFKPEKVPLKDLASAGLNPHKLAPLIQENVAKQKAAYDEKFNNVQPSASAPEHPVLGPDGLVYAVTEDNLEGAVGEGGTIITPAQAEAIKAGGKYNGEGVKSSDSTLGIVGNELGQGWKGVKGAVGGKLDQLGTLSPLEQLLQPAKDVGGLLKGAGGAVLSAGKAAVDTVAAVPDVARTAYGVTKQLAQGGKMSDPYTGNAQASQNLGRVVNDQKEAVRGVAEYMPLVVPQIAAGLSRGVENAADAGIKGKEGVVRGLVSGLGSGLAARLGMKTGKKTFNSAKNVVTGANATNKIAEMLQPQANAKEIKLAMADNRYTSGKESKLFGKKEATIAPSKEIQQAAATVHSIIPGAKKMVPEKLKLATEQKVKQISEELKPELQKVQLTDPVKEKMMNEFLKVKESLMSDVNFMNKASGAQILKTFEDNFMMKALDAKNLDEIWDIRQKVDKNKTIAPKSARDATELSEAYLKDQQEAWYKLRNVLGDAVKDAEGGFSSIAVRNKFKKLRDLMVAKNALIQKAPHEFKKKGGFLSKKNIITGIITAAGGGTLYNTVSAARE